MGHKCRDDSGTGTGLIIVSDQNSFDHATDIVQHFDEEVLKSALAEPPQLSSSNAKSSAVTRPNHHASTIALTAFHGAPKRCVI